MFRRALAFTFCLLSTTVLFAQTKSPVEGVWRVSEVVTTGANAATNSNPQPSVFIFTRGHYSQIAVTGAKPRPPVAPAKDPQKLTDAEKIARFEQWAPFIANSGTYEIKGSTLTIRPMVAKNVAVMTTNPPGTAEFKLEGNNTLWVTTRSAPGQPASETRVRLTRVE